MTLVGELALWLALLTSAWATIASAILARRRGGGVAFGGAPGLARSAQRALRVTALALLVSTIALAWALVARDLSVSYVAAHVNANLPTPYALAALWSGGAGALLVTTLFAAMASVGTAIAVRGWPVVDRAMVAAVLAFTTTCLLVIVALAARPFAREAWLAADGRGLNPQLQHPLVLLHPLLVLAGEALSVAPFALVLGSGWMGRRDVEWLGATHRAASFSWFVLTAGIALGMRWAYVQLGWGGVWNWDPVQNGALLVWLALTAFLHAAVVSRRTRAATTWARVLAAAPFLTSIAASMLAHGGVLASAHSFARTADERWLGGASAVFLVLAIVLIVRHRERPVAPAAAEAHLPTRTTSAFIASALLTIIGAVVLWGTVFPLLATWVLGEPVTVGGHWFVVVLTPFALVMLALMLASVMLPSRGRSTRRSLIPFMGALATGGALALGLVFAGVRAAWVLAILAIAVAVVVATVLELAMSSRAVLWPRARPRGSRRLFDRRRAAARLAHAAVAVLLIGLASGAFERSRTVVLRPGETFEVDDPLGRTWRFVSQGASLYDAANERVVAITLEATRDGAAMGLLRTAKRQSIDIQGREIFDARTEVAVRTTLWLDAYVVLEDVRGEIASLRITFKPMMFWVFVGAGMAVLAGLLLAWPGSARSRAHAARANVAPGEVVILERSGGS